MEGKASSPSHKRSSAINHKRIRVAPGRSGNGINQNLDRNSSCTQSSSERDSWSTLTEDTDPHLHQTFNHIHLHNHHQPQQQPQQRQPNVSGLPPSTSGSSIPFNHRWSSFTDTATLAASDGPGCDLHDDFSAIFKSGLNLVGAPDADGRDSSSPIKTESLTDDSFRSLSASLSRPNSPPLSIPSESAGEPDEFADADDHQGEAGFINDCQDGDLDRLLAATMQALEASNNLLISTLADRAKLAKFRALESQIEAEMDRKEKELEKELKLVDQMADWVSKKCNDLDALTGGLRTRTSQPRVTTSEFALKETAGLDVDARASGLSGGLGIGVVEAQDGDATIGKTAAKRLERVLRSHSSSASIASGGGGSRVSSPLRSTQLSEEEKNRSSPSRGSGHPDGPRNSHTRSMGSRESLGRLLGIALPSVGAASPSPSSSPRVSLSASVADLAGLGMAQTSPPSDPDSRPCDRSSLPLQASEATIRPSLLRSSRSSLASIVEVESSQPSVLHVVERESDVEDEGKLVADITNVPPASPSDSVTPTKVSPKKRSVSYDGRADRFMRLQGLGQPSARFSVGLSSASTSTSSPMTSALADSPSSLEPSFTIPASTTIGSEASSLDLEDQLDVSNLLSASTEPSRTRSSRISHTRSQTMAITPGALKKRGSFGGAGGGGPNGGSEKQLAELQSDYALGKGDGSRKGGALAALQRLNELTNSGADRPSGASSSPIFSDGAGRRRASGSSFMEAHLPDWSGSKAPSGSRVQPERFAGSTVVSAPTTDLNAPVTPSTPKTVASASGVGGGWRSLSWSPWSKILASPSPSVSRDDCSTPPLPSSAPVEQRPDDVEGEAKW
ncbi:hypothetical protein IE53DRAFT_39380 [Violaceomyces palustris]|uniref:Uncharacterized protein n=1 Tax=Violaceomyces palustris TaxID=1673888 RepID=A0ACD0P7L1_9BASI|nr:hypothetical protein IE53DRAFT_39380 [Violaceomyces palustris]